MTGLQLLFKSLGWAVLAGTGTCGSTGSILAQTTDGGQNWVAIKLGFAIGPS